ncbi:MAG: response regulator transcription factor [Chloroflexota bacterium]|nr:response regulator transcription factor [Chloroflexota bacterium]
MAVRILVADDEPDVVGIITVAFQYNRPDYVIGQAYNGVEVLQQLRNETYDLLILDVSMPEMDGFEVTRRIRETSNMPIILLTAKGLEQDKVRGLELGADDYVTKPFSHKELIARVDAVLRRTSATTDAPVSSDVMRYKDLEIDFAQHQVRVQAEVISLTPTEYRLLYHLANNRGRVLPQETLLAKVWGAGYRGESHYLKVYIRRLREKIESDPAEPEYILTVRGVGYTFPGKEAG